MTHDAPEHPDKRVMSRSGGSTATQDIAIQVVGELGHEDIAKYLRERISEVTDIARKVDLIGAHARLKGGESTDLLIRLAADKSESIDVRGSALFWLTKIDTRAASGAIIAAFSDPDPAVRRKAIGAMITLPYEEAIQQLLGALEDNDEDVKAEAIGALLTLNAREATSHIRQYFAHNPASPDAERARRFLAAAEEMTVVSNLPPLPKVVAWRDSFVGSIVRSLEQPSGRVAILAGPGGVGKSTAANLVARAVEAEVKLWLTADLFRPGALASSIDSLATATPGGGQPGRGQRAGLHDAEHLLEILQKYERKFFLVLDGLDEADPQDTHEAMAQLASAARKYPRIMVLATTRLVPFRGSYNDLNVIHLDIDRLDIDEAEDFILSMALGFSGEDVHRLAQLAHGSALALQFLAKRLENVRQPEFEDVAVMLDRYKSNSIWPEVVSYLIDGADEVSRTALRVLAVCGGGLELDVLTMQNFDSEGIENPMQVFGQLAARGLVIISQRNVTLYCPAFREAIEAEIGPRDTERLTKKFRYRLANTIDGEMWWDYDWW